MASNDGYVYALNAANGVKKWSFHSPYTTYNSYVYSSPAVAGGVVYVGSYDGYIFALNAANANIIWSYRLGGYIFASPVIVNGTVYVGSFDGKIYALGTPVGQITDSSTNTDCYPPTDSNPYTNKQLPTLRCTRTHSRSQCPVASPRYSSQIALPSQAPNPLQITQSEPEPNSPQQSTDNTAIDVPILGGIITILVTTLTAGVLKLGKMSG